MPTPILSKEFTIIYDSSVFGYATDFTFNVNKSTVEITTLSSAGWKDFIATDKDWSVDFNGLVSRTGAGDSSRGYDYMINQLTTSDASVVVAIKPTITGNKYFSGAGFLTGIKMSGGVGSQATFSGTVQGTGSLTQFTV